MFSYTGIIYFSCLFHGSLVMSMSNQVHLKKIIAKLLYTPFNFITMIHQLCCQNMIILTAIKNMIIPNEIFSKRDTFHIWISIAHYLKSMKFITNESNALIIGISESKLDSSILNSEADVIRMDSLRRGETELHVKQRWRNRDSRRL